MKKASWWRVLSTITAFVMVFGMMGVGNVTSAVVAAPEPPFQPQVGVAERADTSASLRYLASKAPAPVVETELKISERRGMPKFENAVIEQKGDAALQATVSSLAMPTPIHNFDGITNTYGVAPPDTDGDIGYDPNTGKKYYVQWVNNGLQAWDVTGATPTSVLGPLNGNLIWTGFGGRCESDNDGDPIVLFDHLANRWLISQFAVSSSPYYQCIAISTSGDPTGTWYRYAFNLGTDMNDYPKFGVWPDGYYMTDNQFAGGSTWAGGGVYAFNRAKMLAGDVSANYVYFNLFSANADFGGMLPSDLDGSTLPPVGSPNYFFEVDDSATLGDAQDTLRVWEFHVDWANTANSTFGLSRQPNQLLPVANFDPICSSSRDCITQPGTQKLDAIGDRLMFRAAYRVVNGQESVVLNHTVDADATTATRAGVRWYELHKSGTAWAIYQQSTYAPADTENRWMASIAQDHMGNTALGFSASSATVYPSIRYAGRLAQDPLNEMSQGEATLHAGTAAQSGVNRWGDYSMLGTDPVDDCTFWYTQEYSNGGWDWRTRIGSFKFPNCSLGPQGTLTGTVTVSGTGAPIAQAKVLATLSPTQTFSSMTDAAGFYQLLMPVGQYTVSTQAYGYTAVEVTGISVVSGTTTTQNFQLTAVPTFVVSGTVKDAVGGWPLYANITVDGIPFNPPAPNNSVWTNPATGYYSLTLAEGVSYTLHATAWAAGYSVANQALTTVGDQTVDLTLTADMTSCLAPGYHQVGGISEKFDSVTAPALPAGWGTVVVTTSTTSSKWATSAASANPAGITPQSAPNVAYFNSYNANSGGASRLFSAGYDMTTILSKTLSFWMYHDSGYSSSNDALQVQVSTDGTTWTNLGSRIPRYSSTAHWEKHTVDLSAYGTETALRLGFLGISAYGNDVHIDDIMVGVPVCTSMAGGLVIGNVYDDNFPTTFLTGAKVTLDDEQYSTVATADPAVGDAFYMVFAAAGETPITAAMPGGYLPQTLTPTVVLSGVVTQNFSLKAGLLDADPDAFAATLVSGETATATMVLGNNGGAPLVYELAEVYAAPKTLAPTGLFQHRGRHLGPKNLNLRTLEGVVYYLTMPTGVPALNAGTVVMTWTLPISSPWGVGYNTEENNLWVSSLGSGTPVGDNKNHQFLPDGTKTGATIDTKSWQGTFAADMTYNPFTNKLWQVNVGGDNCIYELDPVTRAATGKKICPAFDSSQRGLAFDPVSNTFFAGSWNNSVIYRFNTAGDIIEEVNVGLPIAGLAYNPTTNHLFVAANSAAASSYDMYVLDAAKNYALLGGFNVDGVADYGQTGLEIDCAGRLWLVDPKAKAMKVFESGETNICAWSDIPWLSEAPNAGTLAAGAAVTPVLTFDATGMQPGVYSAMLMGLNDTPYSVSQFPVTLTVTAPDSWGTVSGQVSTAGYCDVNPAVLSSTQVLLENSAGATVTVNTDAQGRYSYWFDAATAPLTVSFNLAGYVSKVITNVALTSQTTTTVDIQVRKLDPCVRTTALPFDASLAYGASATRVITVTNAGAADAAVTFVEIARAATAPVQLLAKAGAHPIDAREAPAQVGRMAPVYQPSEVIFNEGFEGGVLPPTDWSVQVMNEDFTWGLITSNPHGGVYALDVEYDENLLDQDEWLLSPEMVLSGGTLSFWSLGSVYWCKTTYDNCDLNVWLVRGAPGGGDDILVGKGDDAWAVNFTYAQSTFNLASALAGVNGPVRIGFQYIGNDGAEVALDDIVLDGTVINDLPWLTVTPTQTTVLADGSAVVTVTVTALPELSANVIHNAALRIKSNDPLSRTIDVPISLAIMAPPSVTFETPAVAPLENTNTVFTATVNGTKPITYTWNFGDGSANVETAALTVTHIYTKAGMYTASVTATNALGTDFYSKTVAIEGKPYPAFAFPGGTLRGGMPVTFTNSTYAYPAVTSYAWNFGDPASGANNTSTLAEPAHTFYYSGTYTVTLTATNARGSSILTQTVVISGSVYRVFMPVIGKNF